MLGFLPHGPSTTGLELDMLKRVAPLPQPHRRLTAEPEAAPGLPLDHTQIPTAELFAALSVPAGDLVANGRVAKFLIDLRPSSPQVHFVNGNFTQDGHVPDAAKYHYFFARQALAIPESLDDFNRNTYFTEPKIRYVAGVVHTYVLEGST